MLKKLKPKSEFSRNVLTLMTGTAIAQAIPMAISPILTRLYTPENFGIFALYMSISGILISVSTARYESAIILPKQDKDAINIVALSILIVIAISIFTLLIVSLFNNGITNLIGNQEISVWLYAIPLTIFLSGIYKSLNLWVNRKKNYKLLSTSVVTQSISTGSLKAGFGFLHLNSSGLIVGTIFGQFSSAFVLVLHFFNNERDSLQYIKKLKIIASFRKYINFLKFSTPGAFFQTIATNSMSIFINIFFNTTVVGLYYFANSMLRAPLNLVFASFAQVYRQKAAELYHKDISHLIQYTRQLQKKILYMLIPFIIFMFLFSPLLFKIVFGESWEMAGEYVRYFLPLVFFSSLFAPVSSLVDILGKQKFELYWKISFFIFQVLSLYISSLYFSFKISILIMSIFGSLHYIYINYYLQKVLEKKNDK